MKLTGKVGSSFEIQFAPSLDDLSPWYHLGIVTQTINPQILFDPLGPGKRFYRALPIPTNPNPVQLVWIPAATFTMGSPTNEPGREADEQEHLASITESFWMGRHEVTQGEYMAAMLSNPSQFVGDSSRPVDRVTWQEAMDYCSTLSAREQAAGRVPSGYTYRLPTEAEWEYAARAGSATPFFFGDDSRLLSQYAWTVTNSGGSTRPVAGKIVNPLGLSDIYGNVAEWCFVEGVGLPAMQTAVQPAETRVCRLREITQWDFVLYLRKEPRVCRQSRPDQTRLVATRQFSDGQSASGTRPRQSRIAAPRHDHPS